VSQEQYEPVPPSQVDIPSVQQTAAGPTIVVEGPLEAQVALTGDPLTPLLATRLHVPRVPVRLVSRARLIELYWLL